MVPLSAVVVFFFFNISCFLVLHLYSESNKEKEISLTVFVLRGLRRILASGGIRQPVTESVRSFIQNWELPNTVC